MRKVTDITIIVGFLIIDWLLFHDFLKAGERYTVTEYLTGLLSIPVLIISARSLLKTFHGTYAWRVRR